MAMFTSSGALIEKVMSVTTSLTPLVIKETMPTVFVLEGTLPQTIVLPVAATLLDGYCVSVYNKTIATVTIQYPDLSTFATVSAGYKAEIRLIDNASANWTITRLGDPSSGGLIGVAEDGSYADGLFSDFTAATPIGTAIDRFNEVLKNLAPSPAPALSTMNINQSGVSGALSFDSSNAIPTYTAVPAMSINSVYSTSGNNYGVFSSHSIKTGTLNWDVTAESAGSYPADVFGPGDQGMLNVSLNGFSIISVDLSTFVSGTVSSPDGSSVTISAATPCQFPNASPFSIFKWRNVTFSISVTEPGLQLGYNYLSATHTIDTTVNATSNIGWVVDTDSNVLFAASGNLGSLAMAGTKNLSGVKYHTSGSAAYSVSVGNAYRNVYSSSASAISFATTNCSVASMAIPALNPPTTTYTSPIAITNRAVTVTGSAQLNSSITVGVNCTNPLKSMTNQQPQTISGLLMETRNAASTAVAENFEVETIRLQSVANAAVNNYAAQTDIATGAWTSTTSILSGGNGYDDGLLYYNSNCVYPTNSANGGNFAGITNGPASNVDYSTATGTRYVYWRFQNNTGLTKANFAITIAGASSTFGSGAPAANALLFEMKFPAGSLSTATGWMNCYLDYSAGLTGDGAGARIAANGVGQALATPWGLTTGTKSVANGEYVVFRISAASAWAGSLSGITLTWIYTEVTEKETYIYVKAADEAAARKITETFIAGKESVVVFDDEECDKESDDVDSLDWENAPHGSFDNDEKPEDTTIEYIAKCED